MFWTAVICDSRWRHDALTCTPAQPGNGELLVEGYIYTTGTSHSEHVSMPHMSRVGNVLGCVARPLVTVLDYHKTNPAS